MKHLKKFENVSINDIDFNKIYIYKNSGFMVIGKITSNDEHYHPYKLFDIFDNYIYKLSSNYSKDNYSKDIDFTNLTKYSKSLSIKELSDDVMEATPEETEKYFLSLSASKFNL